MRSKIGRVIWREARREGRRFGRGMGRNVVMAAAMVISFASVKYIEPILSPLLGDEQKVFYIAFGAFLALMILGFFVLERLFGI